MANRPSPGSRPLRRMLSGLLLLVGLGATLGTAVGFFGSAWWGFDRIADWRLPLAAVLLTDAVIYGVVFRKSLSALFLAAAVVNAVLLTPMWLGTQADAAETGTLRVASFDAAGMDEHTAALLAWLEGLDADIVFLHRAAGGPALPDAIFGYRTAVTAPAGTRDAAPVILTADGTSVAVLPTVPGADFTVSVAKGETVVTFVGVATDAPSTSDEADRRSVRFARINAALTALDGPFVVTGDLQASRWSHAFGLLSRGLTNSEDGFGYAATWVPFAAPFAGVYSGLPLDHALYRGDITVTYRLPGPDLGTAHRPLLYGVTPAAG